MEEVIGLCWRYAEILGGTLEIDVRPVGQDDEGGVKGPVFGPEARRRIFPDRDLKRVRRLAV